MYSSIPTQKNGTLFWTWDGPEVTFCYKCPACGSYRQTYVRYLYPAEGRLRGKEYPASFTITCDTCNYPDYAFVDEYRKEAGLDE